MRLFILLALSVWVLVNLYVCWRVSSLAWFQRGPRRRRLLWVAVPFLFLAYPTSRYLYSFAWERCGSVFEIIGGTWMGVLLLLFCAFFIVELVTLGGFFLRPRLPRLRLAAVLVAMLLSLAGIVQGQRDPVLSEVELVLPRLPRELEGLRVAVITDMHLGTRFDGPWLEAQAERVAQARPGLIVLVGDIVDSDARRVAPMLPALGRLKAPLGVWAVLGNHDVYAGAEASASLFARAGIRVLRDDSALAAPGLRLVGVDDLGIGDRGWQANDHIGRAFAGLKAEEACIYLSHTPVKAEVAEKFGAGLMLSGHTHAGQIWPFGWVVRQRFPLLEGLYEVGGMQVYVSRGTGGWGPRMRLWKPGQIPILTLRSGQEQLQGLSTP